MTDGSSPSRCAEPLMLRGRKLKQVNPDLLCREGNSTGIPQEAQKDDTNPFEPVPLRNKLEATTTCHTYLFPQMRMDCSKRGKLTVHSYFPKSVWFIVSKSELQCNCSWKVRKRSSLYDRELTCLWLNITAAQLKWLNFIFPELAKKHVCFGKVFSILLLPQPLLDSPSQSHDEQLEQSMRSEWESEWVHCKVCKTISSKNRANWIMCCVSPAGRALWHQFMDQGRT